MGNVILQLALMSINLYVAHLAEKKGRNGGFSYFVAGFCLMAAIHQLAKL